MSWDVGFQWPSVHGARVVTRTAVDPGSGETIYFVSTAGGLEERVPEKHMAFDVKRDTTTFTTRLRASEGAAREKVEVAEVARWHGFTDALSATAKARAAAALAKQASLNGQVLRRGDHVQRRVAEGWRVAERGPKRIFEGPDGRYLTESDLTKTGLDYATFLTSSSGPSLPPGTRRG